MESAFVAAVERTIRRYRRSSRTQAGWVGAKLRRDPIYRELAAAIPQNGQVLDLGCGRGQTSILLAELAPALIVDGYDWDERRLTTARQAAADLQRVRFHQSDIRRLQPPRRGSILLLDVLHYLRPAEQDALLLRLVAALEPGGRLWIRDLDATAGWRAWVTRVQERLARWLRWHRGPTLSWRSASEVMGLLERSGLSVKLRPNWQGTPFANVLIEARKPH